MQVGEKHNNVVIIGEVLSFDRQILKKQALDIYDTNENFLASTKTNKLGIFKVGLPLEIKNQEIDLRFRVSVNQEHRQDNNHDEADREVARRFFSLKCNNVKEDVVIPIVVDSDHIPIGKFDMENVYQNEGAGLSYLKDIGFAAAPALVEGAIKRFKMHFGSTDVESIQDGFHIKPIELNAANTWKFITNGICPIYFKESKNCLVSDIKWDRYEFDKLGSLPNVKISYRKGKKPTDEPHLEEISVQFRHTLAPSSKAEDFDKIVTYINGKDNFQEGLRIANSVFHLYGQSVFHLCIGHVYGAKIAQLTVDYLSNTKLGELLLPHCRYIRTITNVLGEDDIFGKTGVLNCSGLSVGGISRRIRDTLAALDPFSFKPRQPFNGEHKFALAQNLYYKTLRKAIREFVSKNEKQIKKEWSKVHKFFFFVHKSSPMYRPWDGINLDKAHWQSASEIGGEPNPKAPDRTKYRMSDAEVRSIRWIARDPRGPDQNDLELTTAFITDFIHRVTFYHSWIHQTQFAEGGFTEPLAPHVMDGNFSPITVSNNGKNPIEPLDLIKQEEISKIFRGFKGENYTLLNSKEVNAGIVEGVNKIKGELLNEYKFDADKGLYYSTVI